MDILISGHGRGLIAGDIVDLTASDIVDLTASHGIGLLASDFVQLIAADGCGQILLVIFLHIAFNRCSLVSADGVFLISIDLVGLVAPYVIRHIAGCIVHDILCIVCDGAVFGCIGNSIRLHLNGRFLPSRSDIMPNLISSLIDGAGAFVIGHRCLFSIYRLCIGQRFLIPICILVLDRNGVSFCRFLFKIGFISIDQLLLGLGRSLIISMRIPIRVCHLVRHTICCHIGSGFFPVSSITFFGIGSRTFFIMSEFAFCCDTIPIGYFSIIRNTIRRNGSSTVMLVPINIQFVILHGNLAYIELTIYRQVSTNLRITSCFQSASFDIAGCCDVSSSCVHSIAGYFAGYCQTATCNGSRSCIYSIAGYFACRS